MFSHIRLGLTSLTVLFSALAIPAQELNIDLGAYHGTPSDLYGAASGQTGPWNTVELGVSSGLLDTSSATTAVSITVSAAVGTAFSGSCAGDPHACVSDYIYTHNGAWAVTLSGLASGSYGVWLYAPSHASVATGNMLINGIAVSSIAGTTGCDLTNGVGSVWVSVEVLDGTLSMTGDYAGTGYDYAGLAALQLTKSTRMGWNIDLGAVQGRPSDSYGAASGQTGLWNIAELGFNAYLLDTEGAQTIVSANVSADSDTDSYPRCVGDSQACMSDYIRTTNGTWTINFSDLRNGIYEVFLYAPSHSSVATGIMLINGVAAASITGNIDCDLIHGTSWVRVRVAVLDGTLSMTGASSGSGYDDAGLAALQLIRLTDSWWNIDLGAGHGTPSDAFGAIAEQPGRWNTIGLGVTSHLVDTVAAVTAVSIDVSAQADTGQSMGCPTADGDACVADTIYTTNGTWTVDLSNLTNGIYDVFLYAPRHPQVATGIMFVNGITVPSIAGVSNCDLTEGVGSARARVEVVDGTLSMTGNSAGSGYGYAGLAAFQLTKSDILFDDDFESGNISAWSTAVP